MIPSVTQSGYQAIQDGVSRFDAAAKRIARGALPEDSSKAPVDGEATDAVGDAVDLIEAKHQVELGAAVVRKAAQTTQSLIDLLA